MAVFLFWPSSGCLDLVSSRSTARRLCVEMPLLRFVEVIPLYLFQVSNKDRGLYLCQSMLHGRHGSPCRGHKLRVREPETGHQRTPSTRAIRFIHFTRGGRFGYGWSVKCVEQHAVFSFTYTVKQSGRAGTRQHEFVSTSDTRGLQYSL